MGVSSMKHCDWKETKKNKYYNIIQQAIEKFEKFKLFWIEWMNV